MCRWAVHSNNCRLAACARWGPCSGLTCQRLLKQAKAFLRWAQRGWTDHYIKIKVIPLQQIQPNSVAPVQNRTSVSARIHAPLQRSAKSEQTPTAEILWTPTAFWTNSNKPLSNKLLQIQFNCTRNSLHGSDSRDEITHRTILTAKNLYNKCSTYHCFLRRHTAGKASCLSPLSTSKLPYLVRASCTSALDIASTQDDSHLCCHSDYPLSTKRAPTTGRQSFKVLLKLFCNSCMLFVGNELPLASQLSQDQPGWTVLELWKHYLTMTVQAALVIRALGQVSGISNKNTVTKADLSKPARQTPLASFDHLLQLSQCKKCGNVRGSLRVTWPRSGSSPVSNSDILWLIIYDRPIYVCVYIYIYTINQKNIYRIIHICQSLVQNDHGYYR